MPIDSNDVLATAESGDATQLRDLLRSKALSSLYYFAKVVMNNPQMTETFHLPACDEIQNSIKQQRRGILWARGHFKSTVMKAYVLWRLVGGGDEDLDYNDPAKDPRNRRVLFAGESDTRVVAAVTNIKWHILNNQLLRWLFPEIIPEDVNAKGWTWRDDAILLPRSQAFDEPTIRAVGVGTKVTGYHGDLFIFDDLIGEDAAKSETKMQAAVEWFTYHPGLINNPATVEILIPGTRWKHGKADLYGYIMEELPYKVNEQGENEGFLWFVHSAIKEDGEPAFPERFSMGVLAGLLSTLKDYKFSCQYLNTPSTPAGADFPTDKIKTFRVECDTEGRLTKIVPLDGTPPVFLNQLARITFYDPSSGGKSAGCENAIIVLGTSADGRQFAIDAFLQNCGYRAAIEAWHVKNDKFVCHANYYEAVGAQKEIEEFITQRAIFRQCLVCQKVHRKLFPVGVKPNSTQHKDERIRAYLQPTVEEGRLYLRDILIALRQQIVSFPHYHLKDGIDALAYAVKYSSRPSGEQEILDREAERERAHMPAPNRTATADRVYGGYV